MKRFVCFLLAMILIMGMVPATAVTASAAVVERTTSDKALDLLARFEGFEAKKYQVGDKYYIGYGTQIKKEDYPNGITESVARQLMKDYMKTVDKTLNKFAATNNHQLTQYQHDALAIFSYSFDGTGNWLLNGSGPLRSAVLNDKTGNEFINAIAQTNGGDPSEDNQVFAGLMNRRLAEANLYLNNVYNYSKPSNYTYVVLDENGDEKASKGDTVIAYNSDTYPLLTVVPKTAAGKDFAGWYLYDGLALGLQRGEPVTYLSSATAGKLLVAKFINSGEEQFTSYSINTTALYYRQVFYKTHSKSEFLYGVQMEFNNEYFKTGTKGVLKKNTIFKVSKEAMVDGIKWIYGTGTDEKGKEITGWVYFGALPTQGEGQYGTILGTAKVTASQLDVYEGATNGNQIYGTRVVDTLVKDQVVNIYEIKVEATEYGNKTWGRVHYTKDGTVINGWINLVYAEVTRAEEGDDKGTIGTTGTIVGADHVNVRSSAGITATNLITQIPKGTKVWVLDTDSSSGSQWLRVRWEKLIGGYNEGWVYMHYVQLDGSINDFDNGTTGGTERVLYTGVVTSNINLNVREYPSASTRKLKSLPNGTKINIYEVTTYNGVEWGRIGDEGWVCLQYVSLKEVENKKPGSGTEEGVTTLQGTVTTGSLNVLKNYNSNAAVVGTLKKGATVTILEKNTETTTTGSRIWGRIATEEVAGWINLAYVDLKTVTTIVSNNNSTNSATPVPAVVSDCISANVREEAGVNARQLTKLNNGTAVTVYEQITHANAPWARIKWNNGANEGWMCMYYLTLNAGTGSTNTDSNGIINGTSSNAISATGFVNNAYLNVRAGAGLSFAQIGTLNQGAKVTLFEQAVSDGLIWGRISYNNTSGWVCMSYITVESASSTGKGVMGTIARCFSKANVRSAPGTGNALVSTVNVGSRVEVFEVKTHANQKWGRIPQGWICMEYVLLDSELPEGTILDATTAPTTEATTAPTVDETVNKVGEVAFKIEAGVLTKINVYNDASSKSVRVGTISDGLGVDIRALKNNGAELWGRVDQYGTAGWICLSDGTTAYSFKGYVNVEDAPVYVEATTNSTVKGTLPINKEMTFTKVTTDGDNVYGWVEENIYGWIPMSKISSSPVDVMTVLKSGDSVGSGKFNPIILHGTTFTDVNAYDVIGGSKILFKMKSGVNVSVNKVRFENGKVWALLQQPKKPGFFANWLDYALDGGEYSEYEEAWFDLSTVNYSLRAAVKAGYKAPVYSSMNNPSDSTKVGTVSGSIYICQMTFDSYGNLWARITNHSENAQLNGMFVMVRSAAQGVDGYWVDAYGNLDITTNVTPNDAEIPEEDHIEAPSHSEPTEATETTEATEETVVTDPTEGIDER